MEYRSVVKDERIVVMLTILAVFSLCAVSLAPAVVTQANDLAAACFGIALVNAYYTHGDTMSWLLVGASGAGAAYGFYALATAATITTGGVFFAF